MIFEKLVITEDMLKNANIINPFQRQLPDGTIVNTNSGGKISNRLVSYKAPSVEKNGWKIRNGNCRSFMNMSLKPVQYTDDGKVIVGVNTSITLEDNKTKAKYIIPLNIGVFLTFISLREQIGCTSAKYLKQNVIDHQFDKILITERYKQLLDGKQTKFVIVEDTKNKNKMMAFNKLSLQR